MVAYAPPQPETPYESRARWLSVAAHFRQLAGLRRASSDHEGAHFMELDANSAEFFARGYEQRHGLAPINVQLRLL
jgi:hypothetical protein